MKRLFHILPVLLILCSCTRKTADNIFLSQDTVIITPHESKSSAAESIPAWTSEDGVVVVVFGYGFNGDFYQDCCRQISTIYGLEENGGLVCPLVFPNDFSNRISNLATIVENKQIKGIIIIGGPDNSHGAVAKLQDQWDGKPPFNVFSFFPQDDILGHEAVCNLVLENEMSHSEEIELKEDEQIIDQSMIEILLNGIAYIAQLPGVINSEENLLPHVQAIVGDKKVRHYVDSETSLYSVNHFVIEGN